jgi:DNA binding domain, excisionase family
VWHGGALYALRAVAAMTEQGKKDKKELILDDADRLLSIEEAAARLRTSHTFVSKLIDARLLPAIRFGKNRRIPKSLFNQFVVAHVDEDLPTVVEKLLETTA